MKTKYSKKFVYTLTLTLCLPIGADAHSGRTDSSGGHHDYNNVSGLGSYHYHHGYGPHLHPNGVCPYSAPVATPPTSTSTNKPKTKPVKLNARKLTLVVGEQKKLKITGTKSKIKWSSNKKRVASVNKYGKVTGKTKGKATITAAVNGKKYKCKVKVKLLQ